jgi:hypothetical protein
MNATTALTLATLAAILCAGCDNPFQDDGQSARDEDDAAITVYTQTVNQASSSQDTTIRPSIEVNGDNNIIIVGDRNDPTTAPAPSPAPEPVEPEEPSDS